MAKTAQRGKKTNGATPDTSRYIIVRGARENNLKSVDLDLERHKLIVITGPSGSGKSSLAFDTIYAEGQRRYTESLSAYARQFLERMDKPDMDYISGLSPAIAIEQRSSTKNPRSTVATQTEVYDHLRLLFARVGTTFSPVSGRPVTKDSPRSVAEGLHESLPDETRLYLCFHLPEHKDRTVKEELESLLKRGFFRILVMPTDKQRAKGGQEEMIDLNERPPESVKVARKRLLVVVDRLVVRKGDEESVTRASDSIEMAFREGRGRCVLQVAGGGERSEFSEFFEADGMTFSEPTPQLFSFNSPAGACPTCQGFGRTTGVDPDLVIPNPELSLKQGAVVPFQSDKWGKHRVSMLRSAKKLKIPLDQPYALLTPDQKKFVWEGTSEYIGINGFFRYLGKRTYKMHFRIMIARYRGYTRCTECDGYRVRPDALHVKIDDHHIGEIAELTIKEAVKFFDGVKLTEYEEEVGGRVLEEIRKRLKYLHDVGLDYLTLDRLSQTLSGGESQRINLATSLGSALVGSLYVLDEPSIGLHPRDTGRLINILEHLRDIGNTVIVVEHDGDTMVRADQIVDMGPAAGMLGGEVIFSGTAKEILKDPKSLTGAYLSGRKKIEVPPQRREVNPERLITIRNARSNNLKRVDVTFPLDMITCVTGVSGSGKSTLVHDTLYAGLSRLKGEYDIKCGIHDKIEGEHLVDSVQMVDQSPIGKSPRSNPVTYINAFDDIRKLLSKTPQAQLHGYKPGHFSFNIPGGRCETCQGEGAVKIEMQFLADLYLECDACKGRRYKQETLGVRFKGKNVHDILQMTVSEAIVFFENIKKIQRRLTVLQDVGLGYLTLGQPSNTLSGGEAQRVKLALHLAKPVSDNALYIFDEPTTGLHFDDIQNLLAAFNALVEQGHSVVVIEHNIDIMKSSDWVIDLGPEGGIGGGMVVAEGTPEDLAKHKTSHTGRYLKEVL